MMDLHFDKVMGICFVSVCPLEPTRLDSGQVWVLLVTLWALKFRWVFICGMCKLSKLQ